jgi:hypothetical protein
MKKADYNPLNCDWRNNGKFQRKILTRTSIFSMGMMPSIEIII